MTDSGMTDSMSGLNKINVILIFAIWIKIYTKSHLLKILLYQNYITNPYTLQYTVIILITVLKCY